MPNLSKDYSLICIAGSSKTRSFTTEPKGTYSNVWFLYYTVPNYKVRRREEIFQKFQAVLVPEGSPCTKSGKPGYCETRYIQMDPTKLTWFMRGRCISF